MDRDLDVLAYFPEEEDDTTYEKEEDETRLNDETEQTFFPRKVIMKLKTKRIKILMMKRLAKFL